MANLSVDGPLVAAAVEGSPAHGLTAPSCQPAEVPGLFFNRWATPLNSTLASCLPLPYSTEMPAERWLLVEKRDSADVIDRVVLEQFVAWLQEETVEWVQCCHLVSVEKVVWLVEDHVMMFQGAGEPPAPSHFLPLSHSVPSPSPVLDPQNQFPKSRALPVLPFLPL